MAFNIVDVVKDQIGDQLLGQMGNVLGTDGSRTAAALGGALPGVLSGLGSAVGKPGGAEALIDAAHRQDDNLVTDMGSRLGGGDDTSRLVENGNSALGSLLGGGAVGKLGGALANFAGLGQGGGTSLTGMLAPVVIGAIKRKMSEDDLDSGALSRMFEEQRPNIDAAMPQELAGQLQSEGFFDSIAPMAATSTSVTPPPVPDAVSAPAAAPATAAPSQAELPQSASASTASPQTAPAPAAPTTPDVSNVKSTPIPPTDTAAHTATTDAADAKGGGLMRWLLPVAAVVVLGVIGLSFLGGGDAPEVPDAPVVAVPEVTAEQAEAAAAVDLPEGVEIGKITGALDEVIGSTTTSLESVTDEASARAALPALKDSTATLGGINDLVTRLPEAARTPVAAAVAGGLASLRPIADKVLGMPGVGPVVEPVLGPMLKTLEGLAGGA